MAEMAPYTLPKIEDVIALGNTHEPQISFDINLGRQLKSIDFNTQGYRTYLRERGLSDEQIGETKIHFGSKPLAGAIYRADYAPEYGQQSVYVSRIMGERMANKAVLHETEHHMAKITETNAHIGWTVISQLSSCAGIVGGTVGVGATKAGDILHVPELSAGGLGLVLGSAVVASLGWGIYRSDPEERRALKAARNNKKHLVSIVR